MKYTGDPLSTETLGLVRKRVIYDSGRYSMKSTASMINIKNDMGDAAAVISACENLISHVAYKPRDIIGSMSSKIIEILNTDCEVIFTLAAALHYITTKKLITLLLSRL